MPHEHVSPPLTPRFGVSPHLLQCCSLVHTRCCTPTPTPTLRGADALAAHDIPYPGSRTAFSSGESPRHSISCYRYVQGNGTAYGWCAPAPGGPCKKQHVGQGTWWNLQLVVCAALRTMETLQPTVKVHSSPHPSPCYHAIPCTCHSTPMAAAPTARADRQYSDTNRAHLPVPYGMQPPQPCRPLRRRPPNDANLYPTLFRYTRGTPDCSTTHTHPPQPCTAFTSNPACSPLSPQPAP